MLVGGTRCFGQPWIDDCWWRGSKNFYHSIWEPPIMYVVWKILGTLGCHVDNEIIPLKIIYLYFKIELWHLCKSLLPSAKGLSFTLCKSQGDLHLSLFHFILWQALWVRVILIYISNWM